MEKMILPLYPFVTDPTEKWPPHCSASIAMLLASVCFYTWKLEDWMLVKMWEVIILLHGMYIFEGKICHLSSFVTNTRTTDKWPANCADKHGYALPISTSVYFHTWGSAAWC
jgi:hypothetical protein